MLWHSWPEEEAAALQSLINTFQRIHPDSNIITIALLEEEILERYQSTAALGLGPDIFLARSEWLPALISAGTIRPIEENEIDLTRYYPAAIDLVEVGSQTFAIPLTLRTPALFYNNSLIDEVPQSFDDLLVQAANGQATAINTQSFHAYYGIQAFGKPVITENEGGITLGADGFINWLTWLKKAQENPNIILSQDQETLARLFSREQVSFYIGNFGDRNRFREALNTEDEIKLGITILPAGPNGPSRPLIQADVLVLNSASSSNQRALALELANFLTNAEQNNALLREVSLVPANQRVRVNSRVYPDVFPFVQTVRTASALPFEISNKLTGSSGNSVYSAVLTGVKEPQAAVCDWQTQIMAALPMPVETDERCLEN